MKDYLLSELEKKNFILNYEVEENQIKVNLASRESYVIPYTLYTEIDLLEIMKILNWIIHF